MKQLSFYILCLILIGNSFNIYADIFASYSNTNSIQPYYLSTKDNVEQVNDRARFTFLSSDYNRLAGDLDAARGNWKPTSVIEERLDSLVNSIKSWDDILNFAAAPGMDERLVYRVFNEDSGVETFVMLARQELDWYAYPLDSNYKFLVYNYQLDFFMDKNEFFETLVDGYKAVEIKLGDVDADEMVDVFLVMGDPIYQNIDGNVEIIGYYGE